MRWLDDAVLDVRAALWVGRLMWRLWAGAAGRRR
jgi:hypothetical protein